MNRAGFSFVELLVVAAVGGVLLLGLWGTLATQQRAYTSQAAQLGAQQSVRSGLDVLVTEFRSLSTNGGDIIAMDDDTITIRSMGRVGVVCSVSQGVTPLLETLPVGDYVQSMDSVFVFADGDPDVAFDDTWIPARVGTADTLGSCNGQMAQRISLPGASSAFAADSVREGALLRTFEWKSFGLGVYGGNAYLGQWAPGTNFTPLVGPLDASAGAALRLDYYDISGNVALTPTSVHRVDVTIRTALPIQSPTGGTMVDSLRSTVFSRN